MKRTSVLVLCALMLLSLVLSSCNGLEGHPILGRWEILVENEAVGGSVPLVYHFKEDGGLYLEQREGDEITFSLHAGSFEVKGDSITLSMEDSYDTFTFSVTESRLILSRDGQEDLIFSRV
ncbi:MAG: hypothetical protein IJC84_07100 [Clostridia bacterium]|nr:hypothetical protein [Clostridia bacterium]